MKGNAVFVMVDRVEACAWCLKYGRSGSLELRVRVSAEPRAAWLSLTK